MPPSHVTLALLINFLWGLNFVVSKAGVEQFPPFLLLALRFALTALLLLPFLSAPKGRMGQILGLALTLGVLHFGLLFLGIRMSHDIASLAIAIELGVPFSAILAAVFLGDRLRWRSTGGLVLAFAGVMLVGFDPKVFEQPLPLILVVAAAFAFAVASIQLRRSVGIQPLTLYGWISLVCVPAMVGLSLLLEDGQARALAQADGLAWGSVAYMAIAATIIGHAGWGWLMQRHPVSLVAPFGLLAPIFALACGALLLGDVLSWQILAGGAMTLAGVGVVAFRRPAAGDLSAKSGEPLPEALP